MSRVFLKGSCSFARVRGAVFASGRVPVSKFHAESQQSTLTSRNLITSCSEHVDGLLYVFDARRQICTALEEVYVLLEVFHGGGSSSEKTWLKARYYRDGGVEGEI